MVDKTAILLKSQAKDLGIAGYRTMSQAQLRTAISNAQGTKAAPTKGKATPKTSNGAKGKGKATAAVKRVVSKGKAAVSKTTPAKGKATTAKTTTKGKAATPKRSTAKPAATRTSKAKAAPLRADIDRSKIDWTDTSTNVGKSGKRKNVMDALRKYQGDYDKCFKLLAKHARTWYPQHDQNGAERMVRWLINRVAYDYVMATGQHTMGQRAAYGTSTSAQDIRRRAARAAAKPAPRKRAAAKRTAPKGKATAKRTTAKRAPARKAATVVKKRTVAKKR